MPRWGKVGKQRIEDAGHALSQAHGNGRRRNPRLALGFIDKAKRDGKPFFVWLNPTRMHIVTHLSPNMKPCAMQTTDGLKKKPAWPSSMTISVLVMKKIKDLGMDDNTIVLFTTDNGTEVFTWPDGGQTPFAQTKGTVLEGGFRVPAILRWPGHVSG